MAGTTGTSTWDATGAIAANTEYAVSLTYTGGGSMVLNIGSADRITLSGIPAAFGIAPNTVYFGSDTSGGNQGDATFSSIVFDNTAPSISLTALSPDPNNDNTPTLTGTATEAIGTVSAVQFQMDSTAGSWSSCTADDGTFDEASETFSCTVSSALSDGSHTMYVRATDSNGNTTAGGSESSDTFTVDATAPTVSVTALSPDPTTDSTPTFSGTATDATTALTAIEFQVDSTAGSWTSCSATDGTIDETSEDYTCTTAALTDGSHTIYVRAADSASNTTASAGYASDTFVVDTGSPTVSLTALSPDPTADTTPTITGSISDTLDIISSVQYQIDSTSGLWTTCTASDGSFDETSESLSCTAGSNLTDGSHTIYVRGTDSAGNVSSNASDTFAVDASAPTAVSLDSPGDGDYVPITYPTFKFHTTTDAVSVISKYTLNITSSAGSVLNIGGDISPTGTDTETTDYRLDYDGSYISVTGKGSSKALSEGTYTWKVTATDAAGNSVSSSRTVYVDLFFPSLDNLDLPGLLDTIDGYGLFSTARPKVTGQLGDLQYPYKLTFTFAKQNFFLGILTGLSTTLIETLNLTRTDNATRINFTYTPSRDLDWGKYQLTITGYDKAGNTASKIYQIQMLPEELALKLISKDETQTPEEKQAKIEEIRETAKVSLPELEKKAILRREKEAEELSRVGSQLADWANTLRRVSDRAVSRGVQLVKAAGNNISKAFADIYQSSQKFIAQIGDVSQGGLARFFMETKNLSFRIWKGISQNANNFLLAADKLARDSLSFAYAAYGNVSGILPQAVKSTGGAVAQVNLFVNQLLADSHNRTKAQILLSQADFKDQLQKWADRGTQAVKTASATVSLANKTASQSLSRSQIKVNGEIRIAQENVRNRWRGLQKGISQAASSVNLELLAAQKDGQEKIGQYHSATSQRIKDAGSALQLALRAAKKPATQTAGFIYRVKVGFATFHSIVFDPAPTRISNVAIDEIGPDYAVVSWDTNHYAYSKVNYGQDLSYGQEVLLPERQKHHTARLTGLASQSRYFFEVMSQNKNYAYDAYYSFETP
ncbi:MAG: Hemagglutinin/hemolysin-related protein [Candidatus Amesbacteria bacterium GW2011_GWB1_48_13]|nr:MAG: Hemagglutinin/hemolysin-related protein [Candidatus Amesbacteria bacterium GW2011_GWB1_48_13]